MSRRDENILNIVIEEEDENEEDMDLTPNMLIKVGALISSSALSSSYQDKKKGLRPRLYDPNNDTISLEDRPSVNVH